MNLRATAQALASMLAASNDNRLRYGPDSDVEESTPLDQTPEERARALAETERSRVEREAYDKRQRTNHSSGPNLRARKVTK